MKTTKTWIPPKGVVKPVDPTGRVDVFAQKAVEKLVAKKASQGDKVGTVLAALYMIFRPVVDGYLAQKLGPRTKVGRKSKKFVLMVKDGLQQEQVRNAINSGGIRW